MSVTVASRTTVKGQTSVGGFSPASLFLNNEQGVWYDPSDMTTMFQDSSGTTPVTAVEQPVGLIRDKSGRGNHAYQSTSANRPVLSARVNLATYSQSLATGSAWPVGGGSSLTLTNNAAADPYGGNAATLVVETTATNIHFIEQTVNNTVANLTYTMSCFFKKGTRRYVYLCHGTTSNNFCGAVFDLDTANAVTVAQSSGFAASNVTITSVGNGWYRCSVDISQPSNIVYIDIGFRATAYTSGSIYESYTGSTSENGYWFGADLRPANQGVNLPVYQRVGAATYGTSTTAGVGDYDTTNFPMYLKFDGSNSYLQVPSFALPLIQRMTMVSFAEYTASNYSGIVSVYPSSGNDYNSTSGYVMSAGEHSSSRLEIAGSASIDYYPQWTTSPSSLIPTSIVTEDKTAGAGYLRVNRTQVSSDTSFTEFNSVSNGGLLIGARWLSGAVDAGYRLNGRIYGIIIRGVRSSATEISGAENWLNTKTKAYY